MANNVVVLSDQFITSKSTKLNEGIVGVGDDAFKISPGNEVSSLRKGHLTLRDWLIILQNPLLLLSLSSPIFIA